MTSSEEEETDDTRDTKTGAPTKKSNQAPAKRKQEEPVYSTDKKLPAEKLGSDNNCEETETSGSRDPEMKEYKKASIISKYPSRKQPPTGLVNFPTKASEGPFQEKPRPMSAAAAAAVSAAAAAATALGPISSTSRRSSSISSSMSGTSSGKNPSTAGSRKRRRSSAASSSSSFRGKQQQPPFYFPSRRKGFIDDSEVPENETPEEKKRRLNRNNERRKRARRVMRIDQLSQQKTELTDANNVIRKENQDLKERIAAIRGSRQGGAAVRNAKEKQRGRQETQTPLAATRDVPAPEAPPPSQSTVSTGQSASVSNSHAPVFSRDASNQPNPGLLYNQLQQQQQQQQQSDSSAGSGLIDDLQLQRALNEAIALQQQQQLLQGQPQSNLETFLSLPRYDMEVSRLRQILLAQGLQRQGTAFLDQSLEERINLSRLTQEMLQQQQQQRTLAAAEALGVGSMSGTGTSAGVASQEMSQQQHSLHALSDLRASGIRRLSVAGANTGRNSSGGAEEVGFGQMSRQTGGLLDDYLMLNRRDSTTDSLPPTAAALLPSASFVSRNSSNLLHQDPLPFQLSQIQRNALTAGNPLLLAEQEQQLMRPLYPSPPLPHAPAGQAAGDNINNSLRRSEEQNMFARHNLFSSGTASMMNNNHHTSRRATFSSGLPSIPAPAAASVGAGIFNRDDGFLLLQLAASNNQAANLPRTSILGRPTQVEGVPNLRTAGQPPLGGESKMRDSTDNETHDEHINEKPKQS